MQHARSMHFMPHLALMVPGVRFTPAALVALAAVASARRTALLRSLRELAAVVSLTVHGARPEIMEGMPLHFVREGVRARYRVSPDSEIVVEEVADEWSSPRRIV